MRWIPRRRDRRPPAEEAGVDGLVPPVARADRFSAADLVAEATVDIGARPARLVMTLAGTVLGVGALVATLGFAQTAAGQIARQFDAVAATGIEITPSTASTRGGGQVATARLPWDAVERVERLAGVESAVLLSDVALPDGATVTAVPVNDPSIALPAAPPIVAASAELLDTIGGTVQAGRMFDLGHDRRGDRVAVVGARVAERLSINRIDSQPSIFIGGIAYAVIGIVDGFERRADLLDAVIVPTGAARADFGLGGPGSVQARIVVGAGPQVKDQAPLTLNPADPDAVEVAAPRAGSDLSRGVQSDVNIVFVALGVIVLLAGGLGIANVTMLSVMERTPEIGLRRALGATSRQIAGQFVVESVVIGLLGGIMGAALAVLGVLAVSLVAGWVPVLDPLLAAAGAVLGGVVGLVAGWIPARRAARIEPVVALRS
ncbi:MULTISPECIES: ABC transporter permease [Microbacterium]|uniref:ABC transporter permease n=1 Tax=Microbacterium TaxID=33882 RepID=UPI00280A5204|nr:MULTISPECIES: ABC transporter permease [Microbacterium]